MNEHGAIEVAAAVIFDAEGRVLVALRPPGVDRAGLWEFPGGKLEPGETAGEALARECAEELGVAVKVLGPLGRTVHRYPDKTVSLSFFEAAIAEGSPRALAHREIRWAPKGDLAGLEFCPADRAMAARLSASAPRPDSPAGG